MVDLPSHLARQPDPFIYDQYYLQDLGFAVSWQNPDIHIELTSAPGVPVDSHNLMPGTEYVVVARLWNGSTIAAVADMPVLFSYSEFGIGTTKVPIGQTMADLSVQGGSCCPSWARMPWRTPTLPGHYGLQVELQWPDGTEPNDILGQHNTDVRALNSPRASFAFPVRNDGPRPRQLRLAVDAYRIPALLPGDDRNRSGSDRQAGDAAIRARHDRSRFGVPTGWTVLVQPERMELRPGQQVDVAIDVTAPEGFSGRQALNVNAYDYTTLVGGVTLYVEGTV